MLTLWYVAARLSAVTYHVLPLVTMAQICKYWGFLKDKYLISSYQLVKKLQARSTYYFVNFSTDP